MKYYVVNNFIIIFISCFFMNYTQASEIPERCVETLDSYAKSILMKIANNDVDGYVDNIIPSIEVINKVLSQNSSLTITNKQKKLIATAKYFTPKMIGNIRKRAEKEGVNWKHVVYAGTKSSYIVNPNTNEPSSKIEYFSHMNNSIKINGVKKFLIAMKFNNNKKYYLLVQDSICVDTTNTTSWYTYDKIKWYSNSRAYN